jgi:hypothetical protein
MEREDLLQSYDLAAKTHAVAPLYIEKGRLLLLYERYAEACETFAQALRLAPRDERAREGLASALMRAGRTDDAITEFYGIVARKPASIEVRCGLTECLLRAGESRRALCVAEEALSLDCSHQTALALWNTAVRQNSGTEAQGGGLADYDRFVRAFDLGPPTGFDDLGSFHEILLGLLGRHHSELPRKMGDSARLVSRSVGSLLGDGSQLMAHYCASLDRAIASYVHSLPDEDHPFLRRRLAAARYARSWSTRVNPGGTIPNHVHDGGWISGVYFVQLPDDVVDRTTGPGWIKFGEPPFDAHLPEPVWRSIRPVPGRLVLFPSYLWHGSLGFRGPQNRLSLSFDLVPEEARAG